MSYHSYRFTNEYNVFLFHQWEFDPITIFSYNSNISSLIQNSGFFQMKNPPQFLCTSSPVPGLTPRELRVLISSEFWEADSKGKWQCQGRLSPFQRVLRCCLCIVKMHNRENTHNEYVYICLLGSDVPKLGIKDLVGAVCWVVMYQS